MKYQFLHIEETSEGDIVFLLDTEEGKVIAAPVEWLRPKTRTVPRPKPAMRYKDVEEDAPTMSQHVRRVPVREVAQEVEEEEVDDGKPKRVPRVSIPAAFRGVMVEGGTPGEAIESRRV